MSVDRIKHFTKDDLSIEFPVTIDPGAPFADLSGASAEVICEKDGVYLSADSATVSGTDVNAVWAENRFSAGLWGGQVRITKSGLTQTVKEFEVLVTKSF